MVRLVRIHRFTSSLLGLVVTVALAMDTLAQGLPAFIKANFDTVTGKPTSRFPDWTYAGYAAGKHLPTRQYPNLKVFIVTDYGAVANDGKDDIDAIQRAVDAAGKAGGGIVQFPAGQFDFDVETTGRFVKVTHSNIVIRGYGENVDGTKLVDHHGSTWPNEKEKWRSGEIPSFFQIGHHYTDTENVKDSMQQLGHRVCFLKPAAQHSTMVEATGPHTLQPGDVVMLAARTTNRADSSLLHALSYPSKIIGRNLANMLGVQAWKLRQHYQVERVDGNKIYFTAPLLLELKPNYMAALFRPQKPFLKEVGIEAMALQTSWSEEFHHHKNSLHDNGYDGIKFNQVANGWIRNIRFVNVSTATSLTNSLHCVVYDCRITGNRGHNGFLTNGASTYNLHYQLQGGTQLHTFGLNNSASGNVFHKCTMGEPGGLDCHGGLGVYNLADNLAGGIYASGGADGNTPPGIGTGLVLYNWLMGAQHPYNFRVAGASLSPVATPGFAGIGIRHPYEWPVQVADVEKAGGANIHRDAYTMELTGKQASPWSLYLWLREKRGLPSLAEPFDPALRAREQEEKRAKKAGQAKPAGK